MYNINWVKHITTLLPFVLREARQIAWLQLALKEVQRLHQSFIDFRSGSLYKASFTSQVIYLEKVLNDRFDAYQRAIYIENLIDIDDQYIFNKVESGEPTYIFNQVEQEETVYFYNQVESITESDFIVWVKDNTQFDLFEMKALINFYKLAGKNYGIALY